MPSGKLMSGDSSSRRVLTGTASRKTPPTSVRQSTSSNYKRDVILPFDVIAYYHNTRVKSPDLPPGLIAVQCLTAALSATAVTTLSETIALFSALTDALTTGIPRRAIPITAGADLFQRYLLTSRPSPRSYGYFEEEDDRDFKATKAVIVSSGNFFITSGLTARASIAAFSRRIVHEGDTIVVPAPSRVVAAILQHAAEQGIYFRVVVVQSESSQASSGVGVLPTSPRAQDVTKQMVAALRAAEVPLTIISPSGIAHTLYTLIQGSSDLEDEDFTRSPSILAGAAAVMSEGSVLGPLGTQTAVTVAKSLGLKVVVAVESFKCSRWDIGSDEEGTTLSIPAPIFITGEPEVQEKPDDSGDEIDLDVTPSGLVDTILTEHGATTPAAIAEEILRIWM